MILISTCSLKPCMSLFKVEIKNLFYETTDFLNLYYTHILKI